MAQRLPQFDVIKGIAIFMVVMGHVLTMCIRDIDQALCFKLIGQTHMPLFFFIAGFFTYRATSDGTPFALPRLSQRFLQLIIPMVVVGTLWFLYFPHSGLQSPLSDNLQIALSDEYKQGYWFPLVLFEITVIYTILAPVIRCGRTFAGEAVICLIISAIVAVITFSLLSIDARNYSSMGLSATFLPVYLAGVLAGKHRNGFQRLHSAQWATTAAILLGGYMVYIRMYYWEFEFMASPYWTMAVTVIWHLCLAIVAFAVITPWTDRASQSNTMISTWSLLGRESLGIYLLHYFLLFPMPFMQEPLRAMGLGFVPTFTVAAVVATVIIAITLAVIRIVKISNPLATILIGAKSK
ncbi:MAG: acyltransferase [Muribaculaceae bacterium]|nr:acyltransferase [Muribaculaceae bacterium]MDE6321766.1 acyltransferase [Muribaculaceae bacterium]